MMDVAEVKPDVTGMDMKSTRNPKRRTPIINSTQPARKQKSTTKSTGMFLVYSKVSSDIKDEGPIDTSLIVPKMIYIKAPTIHE